MLRFWNYIVFSRCYKIVAFEEIKDLNHNLTHSHFLLLTEVSFSIVNTIYQELIDDITGSVA